MSFFLLPKIHNNIDINPTYNDSSKNSVCISHSIFNYYCQMKQQIVHFKENEPFNNHHNYANICKIVNPYEFIHSLVPGSNLSISKIKAKSFLFFELLEIFTTLHFKDLFNEPIRMLHFTKNNDDIIKCFHIFNDKTTDLNNITHYETIQDNTLELLKNDPFDFIFFEAKIDSSYEEYVISLCEILLVILKNQSFNGISIIKINHTFHKPVIDILYILSELYNKIYIIKPNISNISTFDKYVVCQNFKVNDIHIKKLNYVKLIVFLKKLEKKTICSLLDYNIPYLFYTKIDEINNIIGQQLLEAMDLTLNLLKNREDKIESVKKINIQKSILWCEKYNVSHNKVFEKSNIFLPLNNKLENDICNEEQELE
jgi:hypothetical protein